jgi:hypothetical protein
MLVRYTHPSQCSLPLFERGLEQRFDMDLCVLCAWVSDCLTRQIILGLAGHKPWEPCVQYIYRPKYLSFFSASNQRWQLMVNTKYCNLYYYWKDSAKTGNSKFLMFKSLDTKDFESYFIWYFCIQKKVRQWKLLLFSILSSFKNCGLIPLVIE